MNYGVPARSALTVRLCPQKNPQGNLIPSLQPVHYFPLVSQWLVSDAFNLCVLSEEAVDSG